MKRLSSRVILSILFGITIGASTKAVMGQAEEQPQVIKAVAPLNYPAIAAAAHAEGRVTVEVKINAAGEVIYRKATEGHPLLRAFAEMSAARWRFAPSGNQTEVRLAKLIFVYKLVDDIKEEETSFSPPYQIEYAYKPSIVIETTNIDPPL